jgi:flagellin
MSVVNQLQAQFGNYSSFIEDRYEINKEFSTNMKTLGDDLVAADVAEESAKLTALQTQQQFAVQAFTAGAQNSQNLLRLLG